MNGMNSTASTGDIGDFFEDVGDFVTSDTFFTIVGTVITLGSYGYVTGVLSALQSVALQETMNAVAGGVVMAGERLLRTGKVTPPNFFEAWQGQLAYRTKKMFEIGGEAFAKDVLAVAEQQIDPATLDRMQQAWEVKKRTEAFVRDAEAAKVEYLGELQRECFARAAGAFASPASLCRQDTLAQTANLANGETIFETTDWNPLTGVRVDLGRLTEREARDRFYEIVRAAGSAGTPQAEAALAVFYAAKQRDADRAERERLAKQLSAEIEQRAAAGDPMAGRIKALRRPRPVGAGAGPAARPRSFFEQALLASILTAPAWMTLLVLPAYRQRRAARSDASTSKTKGRKRR